MVSRDFKGNAPQTPCVDETQSMEALDPSFQTLFTEGYHVPAGETYTAVEARRRVSLACIMVADGTNQTVPL